MEKLTDGKYWYDTLTNSLLEIDDNTTGSDGEPCPPMDCVMVEVKVINDYS